MRSVVIELIRKRRQLKNKEDHIFLDALMDADFIDEEEVRISKNRLYDKPQSIFNRFFI